MITETTESKINRVIEATIPDFEMVQFRSPAKYDGGKQPHFGFFNKETGHAIESFTAKAGYEMTTKDDYVALGTAALDAIGSEGEVKALWTQSKSKAQATIIVCPSDERRRDLYDIGGKDSIFPRLVIEAPFGRSFSFSGGFYRDACRNLDIPRLADNQGFQSSFRHTASLRDKMDTLIQVCQSSTNFENMVGKLKQLDRIEVDIKAALSELYPVPEDASNNLISRAKTRAGQIYSRIFQEQLLLDGATRQDGKCSAWRLVQAITGYVQHDKGRKKGMSETDRAVMGVNDAESKAVWKFADSLLVA